MPRCFLGFVVHSSGPIGKLSDVRTTKTAMPLACVRRERGGGKGGAAITQRGGGIRRLRSVPGMAYFLAPSNAATLAAEEGGDFCGEVGGGLQGGLGKSRGLNYKVRN